MLKMFKKIQTFWSNFKRI